MSFLSAAERFAAIDRSDIVLDVQRCLHSHDHFSTCEACFELCPTEAIQPGKPPTLDANKCQTCLACLPACPVGAYSADDTVPSLLTCIARLETKTVELICAVNETADRGPSPDATGIRVRGCLAGLGVGTYLALAAMGLERIILRLDACTGCPWISLRDKIQTQVNQTNQWLAHWEKDVLLDWMLTLNEQVERPLWDAKNPPLSRRDLFRLAAHQGQIVMARTISQEPTKNNRHPGRDRLRLNNAITHLPEPTALLEASIETGDFAMLSISDECYACSICARVCPTDALKFQMNDEKTYYWLYFNTQVCIGCEACLHICAPEAVEIDKAPTLTQIFGESEPSVLHEGELSKCVQCKTLFAADSDQDLCPVCEYRRKNPFGSMMPPGVKKIGKNFGGQKPHDS